MKKMFFLLSISYLGFISGCATTQNYTRQEAEGVSKSIHDVATQVSDEPYSIVPECQYLMRNLLIPWAQREYWCDTTGRNSKRTYYMSDAERQPAAGGEEGSSMGGNFSAPMEKNLVLQDAEGRRLYYSVAYSADSEPNFDSLWKLIKENNPEGKDGEKFLIYTGLYKENVLK
ncbi:MAG: hypothetical protein KUG80_04990 [Gammaproteobacteria bacterium]|nr:hypothetical protein [Gammaproteobacteria bacterium]